MSPISGSGKVGADVVIGSNKGADAAWGVGYDGSGSSGDDARGDSGFDGSVGAMLAVSSESGSAGHTEIMDELGSDTRTDDAARDMGSPNPGIPIMSPRRWPPACFSSGDQACICI